MDKKVKKDFKETKFGKFINKAKDFAPELLNVAGKVATGNVVGAVQEVGSILGKKAESDKEAKALLQEFEMYKMEFEKEVFELEFKDRADARKLYNSDSIIQKLFSIIFLIGYGFLSWYLLYILMGNSELPKLAETMITMIWTGTSTKLNTIIDFFFGGSIRQEK